MSDPPPVIPVENARDVSRNPVRLTRRSASQSATLTSARPPGRKIPAEFTRMSQGPMSSAASVSSSSEVTSQTYVATVSPDDSLVSASPTASRSTAVTRTPSVASASAAARPIPLPPPTTTARRPMSPSQSDTGGLPGRGEHLQRHLGLLDLLQPEGTKDVDARLVGLSRRQGFGDGHEATRGFV